MKNPLISIVIPTFNRAGLIQETIDSALSQTYPFKEVIVVNDGSTDDTENVILKYGNRVKYVYQENRGLSAGRNTGINHAVGDYIVFLDDDDLFHPKMLDHSVKCMNDNGALVVVTGYLFFHSRDELLGNVLLPALSYTGCQDDLLKGTLQNNIFGAVNTVLLKTDIVRQVGFFNESMKTCEDWDYWTRVIAKEPRISFLNEFLVFCRVHESMSSNQLAMQRGRMQVLFNANKYLSEDQKRRVAFKYFFALRQCIWGWYACLYGDPMEGRKSFKDALGTCGYLAPFVLGVCCLSYLPKVFLMKMTQWTERLLKKYHKDQLFTDYPVKGKANLPL